MNRIAYTYCLVKYVHNPSIGEMLNIGVILCAPTESYFEAKFNYHYERLSRTFAGFDGDHYREVIKDIEFSLLKIKDLNLSSTLFVISERANNVEELTNQLVADRSLSIQFGGMLAGLTYNLEEEHEYIYQQMVFSQYPAKDRKSRTDEEVWALYRKPLHQKQLDKYLQPKRFSSDTYDYKFEYTFKNEKWHVLKPVNMEYAESKTIQDRATKIFGEASAMEGDPELSKMYILLGSPEAESHKTAYIKAKNLLNKIPIKKEIIEEDGAADFAAHLADYMERHGVLEKTDLVL